MSKSFASTEIIMKKMKTRKVQTQDIPQIIAIQELILKKKVSRKWIKRVKEHLRKQEGVGFVALKGTEVVGFIIGETKGEGFGLEQSGWIEIIGVHPQDMGGGIGRCLVGCLFGYFKKRGIRDIYTAVRWDAVDMLSFFKSVGFDRSDFINLRKHLD